VRRMVYALDRLLRSRLGLFEYWDDPDCLFRVRVTDAPGDLHVSEGEIPTGAPVLELHLWNEHIPPMFVDTPSITAAVQIRRTLTSSTRALACRMRTDPHLHGVQAVGGVTPLFSAGDGSAMEKLFIRLGFTTRPYQNPMGRFAEFWEEVYGWMIMWAYYRGTKRPRTLGKIRRTDFWMSSEEFLRRYEAEGAVRETRFETPRANFSYM
jgi:hypothetical protein